LKNDEFEKEDQIKSHPNDKILRPKQIQKLENDWSNL